MTVFLIRRLVQSVVVLILISFLVFLGIFAVGNPVDILVAADATQQERERVIRSFGLDQPLWEQYLNFLVQAFQGDLGRSFVFNEPAIRLILKRMPATIELAAGAMLIAVLMGIPLGILAGWRPQSAIARCIMASSILGFSLPTFWIGLMLIMVFAVMLGWLPASGRGQTVNLFGVPVSFLTRDGLAHILMPALNLALFKWSLTIRLTRAGVREVLLMDYIKFAYAKGLSGTRVLLVHVLKNTLIPIITVLGIELGNIIAFAVVTETIFAWPGMGKLLIDSIAVLDRPIIVAYLMIVVTMFIMINLIVDILYSVLDPRIQLGETQ